MLMAPKSFARLLLVDERNGGLVALTLLLWLSSSSPAHMQDFYDCGKTLLFQNGWSDATSRCFFEGLGEETILQVVDTNRH